jgi:hypothetical protein
VKGQTGEGARGLTAVASRRQAIAATLAECPLQRWIGADELLQYVRASGNDFAVSCNAWNLYIGELQYGSLGHAGAGILEKRHLLCLLFEYAATLGLIDVAFIPPTGARGEYHDLWGTDELPHFSRYDGLMFFRITPLGAYGLGMVSDYQPASVEVTPVLRVLPDLEIAVIGGALEPGDRLALEVYAVRVSDLVWRLEATKLLAAMEEGRSVGENPRVPRGPEPCAAPRHRRAPARGRGKPLRARPRPRPRPAHRVRRASARGAHCQRHPDTPALHEGGGTPLGRGGLLGSHLPARPARARLSAGLGRDACGQGPARAGPTSRVRGPASRRRLAPAADNALIVQSDGSGLPDVHAAPAGEARAVPPFTEL